MTIQALPTAALPPEVCARARRARDPRFDGRFFVGVVSTGIYCRPVCPAPIAAAGNERFYPSAASAEAAGFRPCLRCRPERAPLPQAHDDLAGRALARIEAAGTEGLSVEALAGELGTSSRHLRRLLQQRCGVGPKALLASHRLRLAKRLLDDSDASISDVALAAGFQSLRAFHASVARTWGRTPSQLRELGRRRRAEDAPPVTVRLAATAPFAHEALAGFLAYRAVPGLERMEDGALIRAWRSVDGHGEIRLEFHPEGVRATLSGRGTLPLTEMFGRIRRLADLTADSPSIDAALGRDVLLAPAVRAAPGRRVPGAWDGFELAVRGILGQQVSVAAARTLTRRLLELCGNAPDDALTTFPAAERIAAADLGALGIPAARRRALQDLARAVVDERLDFAAPVDELRPALLAVAGVGPWTADYICMRAGRDPDAFPAGDLVVRSVLGNGAPLAAREALDRAAAWRPWRAYGVLHLWALHGMVDRRARIRA